jgi:putative transposase
MRDKQAALKFLKKVMRKHGRPAVIVTDRLRSYGAAGRQDTGRWLNIVPRVCHFHDGNFRCSASDRCGVCRNFTTVYSSVRNHFSQERYLYSRDI